MRKYFPNRTSSNQSDGWRSRPRTSTPGSLLSRGDRGVVSESSVYFVYNISRTIIETNRLFASLAWCDLYITVANLFRRFDMQLDGPLKCALLDHVHKFRPLTSFVCRASDLKWMDCYMTYFPQDDFRIRATPCSS